MKQEHIRLLLESSAIITNRSCNTTITGSCCIR